MPFLPARNYESEHTKFIRELIERRPQVDEDRRVPQKAYVYSSE